MTEKPAYAARLTVFIAAVSAIIFVLMAIRGTILNYSPVPFMDMWTGFLDFYMKASAGDWAAWWAPHVDHRIVLSRIIFWLDLKYFGGGAWFSLTMTYVFILLVAVIFARIWHDQTRATVAGDRTSARVPPRSAADWSVLCFLMAWIFSWSQSQNLTFAFQNQFILAQLLPLAGLYFLHLDAAAPEHGTHFYWFAALSGLLAIGSMANGILALPVMAFYAIAVRMRLWRILLLVVLSVLGILLYFYHFSLSTSSGGTPGLLTILLDNKAAAIVYFLDYLASPFTYLLSSYVTSGLMANIQPAPAVLRITEILSVLLMGLTLWSLGRSLAAPRSSTVSIALAVFILYVMLGAVLTAAGRIGFQTAYTSRYVTPVLYAWAAMLLLYWPRIRQNAAFRNCFVGLLALLLYGLMLPLQANALVNPRSTLAEWEFAAMALELQVNDQHQIGAIAPVWLGAPQIALAARDRHLSIFGMQPIKDAHLLFGKVMNNRLPSCTGSLDQVAALPDDPAYLRATGWLFKAKTVHAPSAIYLVDASHHIIGIGLLGFLRPDVARAEGAKAAYSGFRAYLPAQDKDETFTVISPTEGCVLSPAA